MELKSSGPFRRKTIKRYCSMMSTPNPHVVFDDHVARILEQQGFTWKEEPRSVYDPEQLYTALERYATNWDQFEYMDEYLKAGFAMAYKIFAKPKSEAFLDALDDQQTVSKALKLTKSAGLPTMTSKAESLVYAFDRELQIRLGLKAPNPCIAYARTQKNNKTRLVWGYPLEMTIIESRFARPLIDKFMTMRTPMAAGLLHETLGAYIHRYIVQPKGTVVAMDYSKYDSTLSQTMIQAAFRILATWFSKENRDEYYWRGLVHYFIRTPIVMPNGELYKVKTHGVPSGSYFTQMIDSICNVALVYALAAKYSLSVGPRSLLVMGDDSVANVVGEVDLNAWATYLSNIGIQLNTEKSIVGAAHFIGAYWDSGKPEVPLEELVSKAVFPERFRHYEGNPDEGAKDVLRSYASTAVQGLKLIENPSAGTEYPRNRDLPPLRQSKDHQYLTGSDKLHQEEVLGNPKPWVPEGTASLTERIMM